MGCEMDVYIVIDIQDWGDTQKIMAVFKNKEDAIQLCEESDLIPDHAIKKHKLI